MIQIASVLVNYLHFYGLIFDDLVKRFGPLRQFVGPRLLTGIRAEPSSVILVILFLLLSNEVVVVFFSVAIKIFLVTYFCLCGDLAYFICVKLFAGLKFNYFVWLFVSNDEINVHPAHAWNFNAFLEKAPFPETECDIPEAFIFKILEVVYFLLAHF